MSEEALSGHQPEMDGPQVSLHPLPLQSCDLAWNLVAWYIFSFWVWKQCATWEGFIITLDPKGS